MSSTQLEGGLDRSRSSGGTGIPSITAVHGGTSIMEQGRSTSGAGEVSKLLKNYPQALTYPATISHTPEYSLSPHPVSSSPPETFAADFDEFLAGWEKTDPTFNASPPSSPTLQSSSSHTAISHKRKPPAWAGGNFGNDGRPKKRCRTCSTTPPGQPALPAIVCTPPSPALEGSASPIAEILEMEVPLPLRAMTRLEFYEMHKVSAARQRTSVDIASLSIPPGGRAHGPDVHEPISAGNLGVRVQQQGLSAYRALSSDDITRPEQLSSSSGFMVETPGARSNIAHDSLPVPQPRHGRTLDDTCGRIRTPEPNIAGNETTLDPCMQASTPIHPKHVTHYTFSPKGFPPSTALRLLCQSNSSGRASPQKPIHVGKEVPLPHSSSLIVLPSFRSLFPYTRTCNQPELCHTYGFTSPQYHETRTRKVCYRSIPPTISQPRKRIVYSVNACNKPELLTDLASSTPEWLVQLEDWEFPILRLLFPERHDIEGNRFWLDHYKTYTQAGIEGWWNQARIVAEYRFDTLWQLVQSEHRSLRCLSHSSADNSICDHIDTYPPHITLNPLLRPAARILGYLTICTRHARSETIREAIKSAAFIIIGLCLSYQLPRSLQGIDITKRMIVNAMPRRAILGLLYLETCGGIDTLVDRIYARFNKDPADVADPMVVGYITYRTGFAHFGVSRVFHIPVDPTIIVLGPIRSIKRDTLKRQLGGLRIMSNHFPSRLPRPARPREHMLDQLPERIAQLLAFTGIKHETGPAVTGWTGRLSQLRVRPKQAFDFGDKRIFTKKRSYITIRGSAHANLPSGTRAPSFQQDSWAMGVDRSASGITGFLPTFTACLPGLTAQSIDHHGDGRSDIEETVHRISQEATSRLRVLSLPTATEPHDARPATALPPEPFFRPIVLHDPAPDILSACQYR